MQCEEVSAITDLETITDFCDKSCEGHLAQTGDNFRKVCVTCYPKEEVRKCII